MQQLSELHELLQLEQLDNDVFKGENYQAPWGRVFGGQVLAQALHAAYRTVPEGRLAHSMHAYFILGGKLEHPIQYEVDRVRDGGSFSTRRVVALQQGRPIFTMGASFQGDEDGVEHQLEVPRVKSPDDLPTSTEALEGMKRLDPKAYERLKLTIPDLFEFRSVEPILKKLLANHPPESHIWMRSRVPIDSDIPFRHQVLAYLSDYNLLSTATLPHRETLNKTRTFYASLDHSLWFHRDFALDDWLLYAMDSPSASESRGLSRGMIYDRQGRLVATVAQEGLMRMSPK